MLNIYGAFSKFPLPVQTKLVKYFPNSSFRRFRSLLEKDTADGYGLRSMLSLSAIFVHVPKAAGTSVTYSLFGSRGAGHAPAFLYRALLGEKSFDSKFKFTFVRDPVDRFISAFRFLSNGGDGGQADLEFKRQVLSKFECIDDFTINWLSPRRLSKVVHLQEQRHFLCHPGTNDLMVDFVGRFENIVEDYSKISSILGVKNGLPKLNSPHKERKISLSQSSEEKIRELYSKDFKLFDY